jgi:hypothetical protein
MNGIGWWFGYGLGGALDNMTIEAVDPDGTIARAIPPARVIGCVVHASSSLAAPGVISHTAGNRLIVGEPRGEQSVRVAQVGEALRRAGLDVTVSARIQQAVWYKLWGNMTMNPISALTRATCDRILDDDLVTAFVLRVMAEAADVGRAIGCNIAERGEDRIAVTRKLGAIRTSMLQDVEASRPLEIGEIVAAPREIAIRAEPSIRAIALQQGLEDRGSFAEVPGIVAMTSDRRVVQRFGHLRIARGARGAPVAMEGEAGGIEIQPYEIEKAADLRFLRLDKLFIA